MYSKQFCLNEKRFQLFSHLLLTSTQRRISEFQVNDILVGQFLYLRPEQFNYLAFLHWTSINNGGVLVSSRHCEISSETDSVLGTENGTSQVDISLSGRLEAKDWDCTGYSLARNRKWKAHSNFQTRMGGIEKFTSGSTNGASLLLQTPIFYGAGGVSSKILLLKNIGAWAFQLWSAVKPNFADFPALTWEF